MPLTILTDSQIRTLLLSLTREDVVALQNELAETLHDYSTGSQDSTQCSSANQPQRISLQRRDGVTTLFMPASTNGMTGIKIVSLMAPGIEEERESVRSSGGGRSSGMTRGVGSSSTIKSTETNTPQSNSSTASAQSTTPKGSITLLSSTGVPEAFIAAEELTAFRTALAATLLFRNRHRVHSICVFGAGKQAFWHIRLALLLRGREIHHLNIVNRSFERARPLLKEIYTTEHWTHLRTSNEKLSFSLLTPASVDYPRLLLSHIRSADVLFCCTPSTTPLFPASILLSSEGRKKGRYISLIGSYKPHMLELDPAILTAATAPAHSNHHHKHAKSEKSGVVVVDGLEACLKEAGEVIQASLGPKHLVEIGELCMIKRAMRSEREAASETSSQTSGSTSSSSDKDRAFNSNEADTLQKWLERGNVIYKSVGLGVMDVCVGSAIVRMARERGLGVNVDDFS
ncbi:MAG: hypothetical protein MMC33_004965 [Icmadophila ericetorum]|nr:hypothetical protein [Icmadophila ericetorum]